MTRGSLRVAAVVGVLVALSVAGLWALVAGRSPSGGAGSGAGVVVRSPAGGEPGREAGGEPASDGAERGARTAAVRDAEARRGRWTARLLRPASLRAAPRGVVVGRVGRRTGYGARRVFAVARVRPGWVGVRASQRPNGRLGWLPAGAVRLEPIRTLLVADLSERELTLRVAGRVRDRAPIGIGRPGHETPVGRYGVTDRLRGSDGGGGTYGCCVLPLTGHQPRLPAGWTGGSRLALHGTPTPGSVGREVSAGCLRMRDQDIRRVFADVPLGATMVVRA